MRPLVRHPAAKGRADNDGSARRSKIQRKKEHRIELRASSGERDAWIQAAGREGYLSLSDWIRDRCNGAARSRVLLSTDHQAWNTPAPVLEALEPLGPIALDPCSNGSSIVGARVAWTIEDDGLACSWTETAEGGPIFVNPPFDELPRWISRCCLEATCGAEIVALVPARVDTRWWGEALEHGGTAALWRGRVRFLGAANTAPFPIALIYWGRRADLFRRALASRCVSFAVDHRHDPRQLLIPGTGKDGSP